MLPDKPFIKYYLTKENRAMFWRRLNPRLYTEAEIAPPEVLGTIKEESNWTKRLVWGFNEDGTPVTKFHDTGIVELPRYAGEMEDFSLYKAYCQTFKNWFSSNELDAMHRRFRITGQVQAWGGDKTRYRFINPRVELWWFKKQAAPLVIDYDTGELLVPDFGHENFFVDMTSMGTLKNANREIPWYGTKTGRRLVSNKGVKDDLTACCAVEFAKFVQKDRRCQDWFGLFDTNLPTAAVYGLSADFQRSMDFPTHAVVGEPKTVLAKIQDEKSYRSLRMHGIKAEFKEDLDVDGIADVVSRKTSRFDSARYFKREDFLAYQELTTNKSATVARMQELIAEYQLMFTRWKRKQAKETWNETLDKFLETKIELSFEWED